MYRVLSIIIMVLAIALGLVIGTLNSDPASVDLLWVRLEWPLGLVILSAASVGLFTGVLLAWIFSILPLRSRLRKARGGSADGSAGLLKNGND